MLEPSHRPFQRSTLLILSSSRQELEPTLFCALITELFLGWLGRLDNLLCSRCFQAPARFDPPASQPRETPPDGVEAKTGSMLTLVSARRHGLGNGLWHKLPNQSREREPRNVARSEAWEAGPWPFCGRCFNLSHGPSTLVSMRNPRARISSLFPHESCPRWPNIRACEPEVIMWGDRICNGMSVAPRCVASGCTRGQGKFPEERRGKLILGCQSSGK